MSGGNVLGSVVIPAHNEAAVILRCLSALLDGVEAGELDIVVACNGCTDATARLARTYGPPVRVIETPVASKAAALNAADQHARAFPRLYVDADVVVSGDSARTLLDHLRRGEHPAVRPSIVYDAEHASPPVRSYFRARAQVPAVMSALWGAGAFGLSAAARSRFGEWPDIIADDLFVDRQFERRETLIADDAWVTVSVPRDVNHLLLILRRAQRGKLERGNAVGAVGRSTTPSTARDLARLACRGLRPAVDALTYAALATTARVAAVSSRSQSWERDESSRGN